MFAANSDSTTSTTAQIIIDIIDLNDNSPQFSDDSLRSFEIIENSPIGTSVGSVTADDHDSGIFGNVSYSITSDTFAIDEVLGSIVLISDIDREERNSYVVPFTASDGGGLSTTVSITIHILDVNDNAPIFSNQILTGQTVEGSTGLQEDFLIRATDSDIGENGEVTISINKDFENFQIAQQSNGVWKLNTITPFNLDFNMTCVGDIVVIEDYTIIARDNGSPPLFEEKQLTINIQDINNHAPTIEIHNTFNLRERSPIGSVVASFGVSDDDPCRPNNLYTMSVLGEYKDYFRIENGQIILTNDQIDFEAIGSYMEIETKVVDGGTPPLSSEKIVGINLLDINDENPQIHFCTLQNTIVENSLISHQIGNCTISDVDGDSELSYSLSCTCKKGFSEQNCELFSMTPIRQNDSTTIVNFDVIQNIDYEVISEIYCGLLVRDERADANFPKQVATTSIVINVENVNDNVPIFTKNMYHYEIPENMQIGQLVGTVRALDEDVGDIILYSISENSSISVNEHSGELFIASPLDYE